MNLAKKETTKFYLSVIVLIVMTLITTMAQAQKQYTTISKNINPEAQNLYHELSPQGDSLYLKTESIFYKVTFLNSLDRKVYTFNPPVLETKIPLHDIIVGDYTVLVYKRDRIIVFHISRLLEIEKPSVTLKSEDAYITQNMSVVTPMLKQVILKVDGSKVAIATDTIETNVEFNKEDLEDAINDDTSDFASTDEVDTRMPYNLSSFNRSNMQSREEYRRNNLRPNGKPY